MKIVISTMCHSAGIAVALKSYFPSWDVKPLPIYPSTHIMTMSEISFVKN